MATLVEPCAVSEGKRLGFLVQASDADATMPTLTATPLPSEASLCNQANDTAVFDTTPVIGQAGGHAITCKTSDGVLEVS